MMMKINKSILNNYQRNNLYLILILIFIVSILEIKAQDRDREYFYGTLEKVSSFDELVYPYPVKKQTLSQGIEMAYMEVGNGAETIILVHGLGSYAPAWSQNLEALGAQYRCIAVDLPGYGKSSKSDYPGSMSFYAETLREFMDSLGLEKVHLGGHSMGGQISIVTALKYPERIDKLVLAAPAGIETFSEGEKEWFRRVLTAKGVMLTPLEAIETNIGHNFHNIPRSAYFMIRDRYAMTGAGDEFRWYCHIIPKCVQGMVNEPVFRDLPKLQMPVLVLFGAADKLIPNRFLHGGSTRKVAETAKSQIPHAEVQVIRRAGHFVMFEQAEEVNTLILGFLSGSQG